MNSTVNRHSKDSRSHPADVHELPGADVVSMDDEALVVAVEKPTQLLIVLHIIAVMVSSCHPRTSNTLSRFRQTRPQMNTLKCFV